MYDSLKIGKNIFGDKMHISKRKYQELLKVKRDYNVMLKNFCLAFLFGGVICLIGQLFLFIYEDLLEIPRSNSVSLMIGTMILIASILSGFGVYDKLGQIGKSGTAIPITGFANSMVSSAMEYRPEGFILGIGANTFKLSGTVIVLGIFSAYLVAFIRFIVGMLI